MPVTQSKSENMVSNSEANNFLVDDALNEKDFLEFLAMHPDASSFDMNDEKELEKRFETFKSKEVVKEGLKNLYKDHIQEEMGIGLDSKDLSSIDAHLDKIAIEDPEEISKLGFKIHDFIEVPGQLVKLEEQLGLMGKVENLSSQIDLLKNDKNNLENAKNSLSILGRNKLTTKAVYSLFWSPEKQDGISKSNAEDTQLTISDMINEARSRYNSHFDAVNAVDEKYKDLNKKGAEREINEIDQKISQIQSAIAGINSAEDMKVRVKEGFGNIRKELLGGISGMSELTEIIKLKVKRQLEEMTSKNSTKAFDQAQERFEALKNISKSTETGINPLGRVDEEAFQQYVDDSLETKAFEEIMETIMHANLGSGALSKLEKALAPFIERTKIGSKNEDESREFMIKTLREASDGLGDTENDDRAKKLMIARILIKMRKS